MSLIRCIKSLVSRTCVLYNIHTFLHQSTVFSGQPDCVADWRDKIRRFLLKELVSFTRVKWRQNASFPSMSEFIVMLLVLKSSSVSLSLPLSSWQSFPLGSKPAENFGARGTEERSNDEPSRILLKM